jgi:hypothetical protein
MSEGTSGKSSGPLRRAAIIASGIAAVSAVHANSSNNVILVPPTELPALARQSGDAMLLHDTNDGRSVLYVEQNQGAELAVFDVTDPGHVKSKGSVPLGASGIFDFVSPLGDQKELVRFRQDQGEAVLDLHSAMLPSLKQLPGLYSQGAISPLGDGGFTVNGQGGPIPKVADLQPIRDYQVFDTLSSRDSTPVFEVKQVLEELSKQDTGTTFLLADGGLYLIRRPKAEADKRFREEQWFWQHNGE